ncbi:MAG TPA: HEAT repeat domain-containing protein [Pirellulales bacterium]|jgi:hypothetical protein|nr:HEAT repeat domain-containing protein [Pirellulales bacterium]
MSDKLPSDDIELDRLLARARWPEAGPARLERLKTLWWATRRRQRWATMSLIAASALVALGATGWVISQRGNQADSIVENSHEQIPPTAAAAPQETKSHQTRQAAAPRQTPLAEQDSSSPAAGPSPIVGRQPTAYELALLAPTVRKRSAARVHKRPPVDQTIEEAIDALASDESAELPRGLGDSARDRARVESRLASILDTATGPRRTGAARLLVEVGTSRSLPLLMSLLDDPATHEAALRGLAKWMPDAELARFASRTSSIEERSQLVGALVERRTQESTTCFLGLIGNAELRAQALAILGEMSNPPVEPLLALLESSQPALRLAAAQALARLPQPEVAWRLSEHLGGVARQEALMALLMSRSSEASRVIQNAREDVYLAATLYAAQHQIRSLALSSGGILP